VDYHYLNCNDCYIGILAAQRSLSDRIFSIFSNNDIADLIAASNWGQSFGGLGTLISAIGAAAIIVTLIIQGNQFHRQQFESNFFELLKLLRDIRGDLKFTYSKEFVAQRYKIGRIPNNVMETYHGPDAVERALSELNFWMSLEEQDFADKQKIGEIYRKGVLKQNESTFSPYFRIIYTILNMIKNAKNLNKREKFRYSNILRSQLTGRESYILSFNALCPISKDMFDLIVHFRMLKYMAPSEVRRRMESIYPRETFEGRSDGNFFIKCIIALLRHLAYWFETKF